MALQVKPTTGPRLVFLRPNQIVVDPLVAKSRPEPLPPDETTASARWPSRFSPTARSCPA